jgi:hypothetical protein
MQRRWGAVIRHDPFYNPNLTRKDEDYALNFDLPSVPPGPQELESCLDEAA